MKCLFKISTSSQKIARMKHQLLVTNELVKQNKIFCLLPTECQKLIK